MTSFGSSSLPMMWAEATGNHPPVLDENPKGSVVVRADAEWDAVLLPPRCAPAELGGVELATGIDGERYYVPVGALEGMVGTLEREGVHFIMYGREPFSEVS